MFACGRWDYEVLWFPVSLLCFFKMPSLLQSFHSRDVLNGLAERNVVQEWREKVHAWRKSSKNKPKHCRCVLRSGRTGVLFWGLWRIRPYLYSLVEPAEAFMRAFTTFPCVSPWGRERRHVGSQTREPELTPSPWTSQGYTEQPTKWCFFNQGARSLHFCQADIFTETSFKVEVIFPDIQTGLKHKTVIAAAVEGRKNRALNSSG